MHGRNIIKILRAIDLLSRPQGTTVTRLESELGVTRRSVYRLFETLDELGFPRFDEEVPGEKEKRWRLQEDYLHKLPNLRIPDMRLTGRELMVLHLLLASDRVFAGTAVEPLLCSIREKLASIMPGAYLSVAQSDRLESLFAAGTLHPALYHGKDEIIETLLDAVAERKVCTVRYEALGTGNEKSYLIHPLRLFQHDGGLYLFVQIPKHDSTRILSVERISEISISGETFVEPEPFDPDHILSHTFDLTLADPVTVTIRFTENAARRVRNRRWSATQQFHEHTDGSLTLEMTTSGSDDIVRWVLGFGGDAEIIKPAALRARIQEAISRLNATYPHTLFSVSPDKPASSG
ncbi:MAG: WYL domain-containing transcriptional regulator [Spirochaetaceae bacterium]|nr:MAG: WYL domain-containing transcriptional regulator [Spirochaetaceae bacterium]